MSRRPAFQFYVGDWLRNAKLRRCSPAARGAWIDVLCLLHDSDEYGVLRWPLADIAQAAGVPVKLLRELADKGVLKGADRNAEAYIYAPRHAGKEGEPITLIQPGDGPCWFCSRFARDEHVRRSRGESSRFDTDNQPPKDTPKAAPKVTPNPPFGWRQGDGASSSSSTSKQEPLTTHASSSLAMQLDWQPDQNVWDQYARLAGLLPADLTPDVLTEFRMHWHADGSLKREAQWVHKLVSQIKKSKSMGVPHGARQQDARPTGFAKGDGVGREWLDEQRVAAGGSGGRS